MASPSQNRWAALACICAALLVISLDNTILNVALPSIAWQLGASAGALQWVVDAYILVFAALLLTMGALGDRIGRKRTLQGGLTIFAIGSLAAAFAPSVAALIGARAFLGVGAALIMPATLSLIAATFREPGERAKAIAIWSAVFGLGVGLGPLLGGWLLERFSWGAVFLINLPMSAVTLLGGQRFITESRDPHVRPFDIPGVLLSIAGLFALVYGIIEAGMAGWGATNVVVALGLGAALVIAFLLWERRAPQAMLPLAFFRNPSFSGANLALVLIMFANAGSSFLLSQYFQAVQGYSPLEAGLLLLPVALLVVVGSALSARTARRLGGRWVVAGGVLLASIGLLVLWQVATRDTPYLVLLPALALFALGLGAAIPTATSTVMGAVPVKRAGIGSGMNDTTRLLGSALGVAVLGAIVNTVYLRELTAALATPALAALPARVADMLRSGVQGAQLAGQGVSDSALTQAIVAASSDAFVAGMTAALLVGALMLDLAAVAAVALIPARAAHLPEGEPAEGIAMRRPAGEQG